MLKALLATAVLAAGVTGHASAQSTSLTGKIVDFATYVTRDHNMDAMHGGAMHGGAMKGEAMKGEKHGDAMHGSAAEAEMCPEILGIVTPGGTIVPVATQTGSSDRASLCKSVGRTLTLHGKTYTQAGASVFLVSSVK